MLSSASQLCQKVSTLWLAGFGIHLGVVLLFTVVMRPSSVASAVAEVRAQTKPVKGRPEGSEDIRASKVTSSDSPELQGLLITCRWTYVRKRRYYVCWLLLTLCTRKCSSRSHAAGHRDMTWLGMLWSQLARMHAYPQAAAPNQQANNPAHPRCHQDSLRSSRAAAGAAAWAHSNRLVEVGSGKGIHQHELRGAQGKVITRHHNRRRRQLHHKHGARNRAEGFCPN